jgi:LysR family cys regulon transcriptional activator
MNFQQLRFVHEAVRKGLNLTDVANVLHTSQSGVSKQIKNLEAELGFELFERRGKRLIHLTRAGEGALQIIQRILVESENLKRFSEQCADPDGGRLILAATHNHARYVLPDVIKKFTTAFPKLVIDLRQGVPKSVAMMVMNDTVDIGIAAESLDNFPDIVTFPYFTWTHAVVAREDHPLCQLGTVTLADIAQYPIITYTPEFSGRSQIDDAFKRVGVTPEICLTAMDTDVIKAYVSRGMGIGIVSELATRSLEPGLVALYTGGSLFAPCTTKLALKRGVVLRPYGYRLIEMCAPALTERVVKEAVLK